MSGLSRGCRTCCQKQQNKIQPANKKSKREFFRRENTRCTFSSRRHLSGGIFVSGLVGQHLPFTFSSRSVQPVNRQMLFCSFCFPDAKTRGAYFSASKTIASGLNKTTHSFPAPAGRFPPVLLLYRAQRLPRPPAHSFRRQPANISRHHSFHTGPTIFNKPTPFLPAWPSDVLHPFQPLF